MVECGDTELLEELTKAELPPAVEQVILEQLHDGQATPAPALADGRIFLKSIEVEGFRGIGAKHKLRVDPSPGLTLIVGPNGCGKSSFAEAVERAVTGTTLRWAQATTDERANWRNVHHPVCGLRLVWQAERETAESSLKVSWNIDEELNGGRAEIRRPDESSRPWSATEWQAAVSSTPPLLSYAALSAVLGGKQSELFDVFNPILGLASIESLGEKLRLAIKHFDTLIKAESEARAAAVVTCLGSEVGELAELAAQINIGSVDASDASSEVLAAMGAADAGDDLTRLARLPGLDDNHVVQLVARLVEIEAEIGELQDTGQARAAELANLLTAALHVHQPGESIDCPVCGTGALDDEWRATTVTQLDVHRRASMSLVNLQRESTSMRGQIASAFPAKGDVVPVDSVPASEELRTYIEEIQGPLSSPAKHPAELTEAATLVATLIAEVHAQIAGQRAVAAERCKPALLAIQAWETAVGHADGVAAKRSNFKKARNWVGDVTKVLRSRRLESLNDEILGYWAKLRQSSSVEMLPPELTGVNTSRAVELSCSIDGTTAKARSVLSQGELHALGLAMFLARSSRPNNPFGFLMIDDPVHALDRFKVDGLAQVLGGLAETRQVIVFTHDDRLADAMDRLQIPVRVLAVARSERSTVEVVTQHDATERALSEALALALDKAIDPDVATTAVAGFCRTAVEERAVRLYRRRALEAHTSLEDVDATLQKWSGFWDRVSLGAFGDRDERARDRTKKKDPKAAELFSALNGAAHELSSWTGNELAKETRRVLDAFLPERTP
jgi:energy-coupling factor transporter ATP-binding protein EcfA2